MIRFRDRMARGHGRIGWLDSRHTFSFGDYRDPEHMGFRTLRVLNEDRVVPGSGFPTHGHRDMEIITYVLAGEVAHKDSLGNGATIRPGDVQRMTAGTGIAHSEFNPSDTEALHLLQIWIVPEQRGLEPSYEQKAFGPLATRNRLRLVAAPNGEGGAVTIHQDARLYVATLATGTTVEHTLEPGRGAWLQVARGIVALNDTEMREGDGAAIEAEPMLRITAETEAEVLLFDLA